jgi:uncharacterized caspase-like protein
VRTSPLSLVIPAAAIGFVLLAMPAMAQQPMRGVALVIGESKYEQLPVLANPAKDARDIDRLLGDLGFEVDRVLNANGDELREAIAQFASEAKDADIALIYYSGHGIEAKGQNFIAPTDTDLASPASAGASMIAVQPILDELAKVAPVSIVLLDACRSDPFPAGQMIVLPGENAPTAVDGQGLAAIRGPTPVAAKALDPDNFGTVIGFSASPGEPALDGPPGENSPYAAALLKHFAAGSYSFSDVMTMVGEEVYLKTKARQLPWTNSSLRRVLTFDPSTVEGQDADHEAIKTERRKLLLSIAATPAQTQKYVEQLAGSEEVPLDALYGMLGALGIKTNDNSGDLQEQLQKGAERLKQLIAERPEAVRTDPELERLSKLADDAEAEGAIGLALTFRDKASARADTLLSGKQAEAEQLRQDMIDIANTYAANAATAVLNFDHVHAAELYGKAFEAVKDWDKAKAADFRISQGNALSDEGYYTGDNEALRSALTAYGEALTLTPKDVDPANWAKIQNDIGQAQQTLGSRLTDMAMLNESVASFEQAMTVRTEQAAPSDWAVGQNNLGNVLFTIGRRSADIPTLERSVAAFDAALTVFKADTDPVRWSTTESNRASAQLGLADAIYASTEPAQVKAAQAGATDVENLPEVIAARARAVEILSGSVAALEGALKVRPRADSPLDWAMIQHARAAALSDRGKLMASADDVKLAVEAFRDVMTAYDKAKMPVQWATSSSNLATTLRQYSGLIKDKAPLTEAAALLQESIVLIPRAQAPLDWAELNTKLGNVWSDAAGYGDAFANADKAVAAYRAAMEVQTPEQDLAGWERLQLFSVSILISVATPAQDLPRLKDARNTAATAAQVLKAHGSTDAALFEQWVPTLDQFIGILGG